MLVKRFSPLFGVLVLLNSSIARGSDLQSDSSTSVPSRPFPEPKGLRDFWRSAEDYFENFGEHIKHASHGRPERRGTPVMPGISMTLTTPPVRRDLVEIIKDLRGRGEDVKDQFEHGFKDPIRQASRALLPGDLADHQRRGMRGPSDHSTRSGRSLQRRGVRDFFQRGWDWVKDEGKRFSSWVEHGFQALGHKVKNGYEYLKGGLVHAGCKVVQKLAPALPEKFQICKDDDLPLRVLNFPSYGNWTESGWNLRIRAMAYQQPADEPTILNWVLEKVLPAFRGIDQFLEDDRAQAHNTTASLLISQQEGTILSFDVARVTNVDGADKRGKIQTVYHPQKTSRMGDVDGFVHLSPENVDDGTPEASAGKDVATLVPLRGDATTRPQKISVIAKNAEMGEAGSWLLPPSGITVLSDLDDIIKVTTLWKPMSGALMNTLVSPDIPWMNMPAILANWSQTYPDMHFHYTSLSPEQLGRTTIRFLQENYPPGSLDMRAMTKAGFREGRPIILEKIFETFPQRKFILLGDTSTGEMLLSYASLMKKYPEQIACTFIRNVTATDPRMDKYFDRSVFDGIDWNKFMIFHVPDDLAGLDIGHGQCINSTFTENDPPADQQKPLLPDTIGLELLENFLFEQFPFLKDIF